MLAWWLFLLGVLAIALWLNVPYHVRRRRAPPLLVRVGTVSDALEAVLWAIDTWPAEAVWLVLERSDHETERLVQLWAQSRPRVRVQRAELPPGGADDPLPAVRLEVCLRSEADTPAVLRALRALGTEGWGAVPRDRRARHC
jgi:hypothetical protein